ncbi:hypothetical protein DCS_04061 [Drechmeria coniospora]|uniref:Uncharacterized protein n=1 Tax=Drechmeria coniospora TaxID=98403 RepID=A0A151GIY9_DRECN|nr:hypothetical protein DCS_04061 [Drechmeria coniospora]KYK57054.1 hypothetical protein DCS_04061 [Drechmeria coniospora]
MAIMASLCPQLPGVTGRYRAAPATAAIRSQVGCLVWSLGSVPVVRARPRWWQQPGRHSILVRHPRSIVLLFPTSDIVCFRRAALCIDSSHLVRALSSPPPLLLAPASATSRPGHQQATRGDVHLTDAIAPTASDPAKPSSVGPPCPRPSTGSRHRLWLTAEAAPAGPSSQATRGLGAAE